MSERRIDPYDDAGRQSAALERIAEALEARPRPVVLLVLPPSSWEDASSSLERFRDMIQDALDGKTVELVR